MQGAFSEHDHGQAGSDASSLQQQVSGSEYPPWSGLREGLPDGQYLSEQSPTGLWSFLYAIVNDDEKTRRLGYLIKQVGLATSTILIALAAAIYIAIYKSPLEVKIGVWLGSFLLISVGSIVVRLRRGAKSEGGARASPRAGRTTKPSKAQSPHQDDHDGIRKANGADRQDASHKNPEKNLGRAAQP
jgi:hypothetical protein